jgi:hypothetical protein
MMRASASIGQLRDRAITVRERRARLDEMPRTRRSAPLAACAVGLVLIGWGVVRTADSAHARTTTAWPSVLWASVQGPSPGPMVPIRSPSAPTMTPVRIDMPTLGVGAPVVPVAVGGDGALGVPEDPSVVGWWVGAGDTVVLDGHVDTAAQGPGALFRLIDLASGDAVTLTGADGAARRFTVTDVRAYPKAQLPPEVFDPESRLVIITCGGHFDWHTRQYAENIVAFAEPLS